MGKKAQKMRKEGTGRREEYNRKERKARKEKKRREEEEEASDGTKCTKKEGGGDGINAVEPLA